MPLSFENSTPHRSLTPAVQAIGRLWEEGFDDFESSSMMAGQIAHSEIERTPVRGKTGPFDRHFVPLHIALVALCADTYRRYFKVALAHPRQTGRDPGKWAWNQLQPAVRKALEWIRDWYMLACDGENQYVQNIGSIPFVPGQTASIAIPLTAPPIPSPESWHAPAWLFQISPLVGVGPLKTKHVPATDSEEKLGAAHTRLILKGVRRVFLWRLAAAIETVRNEETAAAGAIPAETLKGQTRRIIKRKGWEQKEKLYRAIREALTRNPSLQGMDLCAELDRRHAPPLFDWKKSGEWREGLTWKEAWRNPALRRKIRRVRQEAMKQR